MANLIPQWNEVSSDEILYKKFMEGIELVGQEFRDKVHYYGEVWWPARQHVQSAIEERLDVHQSGHIIELKQVIPWKEHLFILEKSDSIKPDIKFVIFKDTKGKWRVQAVPLSSHSYELRVPLKADWRGLRDQELSQIAGIDGCVFVHSSGFIGGNDSRDGVIQMAVKTLDSVNQNDSQSN